ncbi:MAG: Enoyl-[acyl-carrier-protein] reductase [NADPH] FabL [Alphaproteobacteria bacterium MarineAlpha6_Bin4]|nr:MAG: Enoyl-[acyl-carrier-protein] reductase [NADPH] FabL [Alphaproteobacteria bacterium MarineAlpha6_Bin4]
MENTVLVTGGSQRIGAVISDRLAREGWNVIIHYNKSKKKAFNLKKNLSTYKINCCCIKADLSKELELKKLFKNAKKEMGVITCLINNASTFELDNLENIKKKKWDYHLNTNLWAPIFLIQQFIKNLPKNINGNIINVVDQRVINLTPFFTTYTITKSALWTLTQTTALALAPKIRVNAIGPGPTLPSKRQTNNKFKRQYMKVPLKKSVNPNEIAEAVLFILKSKSLTGQLINIDSGQHLGWATANNKKIIDE